MKIKGKIYCFGLTSTRAYLVSGFLCLVFFPSQGNSAESEYHLITLNGSTDETIDLTETINNKTSLPTMIHKQGDGSYTLTGKSTNPPANMTYLIDRGALRAGNEGALIDNADYIINGGRFDVNDLHNFGTLDLDRFDLTMSSLSGSHGEIRCKSRHVYNPITLESLYITPTLTLNQAVDTVFAGKWMGGEIGTPILLKKGSGKLTLTGRRIRLGKVFINEGTLALGPDVTMAFTSDSISKSDGSGYESKFVFSSKYPLTFNGGTLTNMGELSLHDQHIVLEAGGGTFETQENLSAKGNISGVGSLTKRGPGTLSLFGENTYLGSTTLEEGTLKAGKLGALAEGQYIIKDGILDLNNFDLTMTSLFGSPGGSIVLGTATLTIDQNRNTTYEGNIDGDGKIGLIKKGVGELHLMGDNTYMGTSIDEGTLVVSQDSNLGHPSGSLIFNGGTLRNIDLFSTYRTITLEAKGGTFETQNNLEIMGEIKGEGGLTKSGFGTLSLVGKNTYLGNTLIKQGVLSVSQDENLGDKKGKLIFNGGTLKNTKAFSTDRNMTLGLKGGAFETEADLAINGNLEGPGALAKLGLSTLTLSGKNTYAGNTHIYEGTLSINGSIQSHTYIHPGSTLAGTGTIFGNVSNEGVISPGNSLGTLTIKGDYVGNDGLLRMEFSPSRGISDQLIIRGHASGRTAVELVISPSELGAPIPGSSMALIRTESADPNAFFLASPLQSGARSYQFVPKKGSYNWYLENGGLPNVLQIIPPIYGAASVSLAAQSDFASNDSLSTATQTLSFGGNSQVTQDTLVSNNGFRVATQVYPLSPFLLQEYGANLIGNLHQRKGTESSLSEPTNLKDKTHTLWTRILGEGGRLNTYGRLDYDLRGLQIGGDLYRAIHENESQDHLGVYGVLGKAKSTIKTGSIRLGDQDAKASTLGGYWTHYGTQDQYLDTVLQATRYHNTLTTRLENDYLKPNTTSYAVSVEGGYPIKVKRLVMEPQAQVVYQRLGLHTYQDPVSIIAFDDSNSLRGRIGLRLPYETVMTYSKGRPCDVTVALTGNLWREFIARNRTTFSTLQNRYPVTFAPDLMGTWAEVGIEGSIQVSQLIALYVNGNYIQGLNAVKRQALGGSMGIRVNW